MKKIIYVLVVAALLAGCGQKTEVKTLPVEKAFALENISPASNTAEACRLVDGMIYHYQNKGDKLYLFKTDPDGNQARIGVINKGKGPGEVLTPMAMRIYNGHIHIYDMMMHKIVEYTLDGKYVDEILVQGNVGYAHSFDMSADKYLFNGSLQTELAIVDREGKIQKLVKYPDAQMMPDNGKPFPGGIMRYNPVTKRIMVGFYNAPYRLHFFDEEGNKIMEKTYDIGRKVQPCVWTLNYGGFPKGDFMVSGGVMYDKYFIASPIGGYDIKDDAFVAIKHPLEIFIFDTETGKRTGILRLEGWDSFEGATVIGADGSYIYLVVNDETFKEKNQFSLDTAVAMIPNPLAKKAK